MERISFPQREKEKVTKRKRETNQIKNNLNINQIKQIKQIPVRVGDEWLCCVWGHIEYLGMARVMDIARYALGARQPEHYLMKALSKERYGL